MAIPKIKATYSLDVATLRVLERIAKRWGVSKSEALRRAIQASATQGQSGDPRAALLDELQSAAGLSNRDAAGWERAVKAERRSSGKSRP
jgi:hypothetical protein